MASDFITSLQFSFIFVCICLLYRLVPEESGGRHSRTQQTYSLLSLTGDAVFLEFRSSIPAVALVEGRSSSAVIVSRNSAAENIITSQLRHSSNNV